MAPTVQTSEWKTLAEQASVEMDGAKLAVIVKKLCAALDAQSQRKPSITRENLRGNQDVTIYRKALLISSPYRFKTTVPSTTKSRRNRPPITDAIRMMVTRSLLCMVFQTRNHLECLGMFFLSLLATNGLADGR